MKSDRIEIISGWGSRPEDGKACKSKLRRLLTRLQELSPEFDDWIGQNYTLKSFEDSEIDRVVFQSTTDERPPRIMPQLGYQCSLASERNRLYLEFMCGSWWTADKPWAAGTGNGLNLRRIPDSVVCSPNTMRALLLTLVEIFDPLQCYCVSDAGVDRFAKMNARHPIIDWMIYIANVTIPPEALPMVHSVERVGTGSLVILKKERLHLDRPEDLALLDAAEPIIRSFIPPPPAAPPQPNQPAPRTLQ